MTKLIILPSSARKYTAIDCQKNGKIFTGRHFSNANRSQGFQMSRIESRIFITNAQLTERVFSEAKHSTRPMKWIGIIYTNTNDFDNIWNLLTLIQQNCDMSRIQCTRSECHPVKIVWLDLVSFSLNFQHRTVHNCSSPKPKFHHLKFHNENSQLAHT